MGTKRPRLAQRRATMGFTQELLAQHLKIDRTTVTRWEAGTTDPSPWVRRRLAKALGVSPDDLDDLLTDRSADHADAQSDRLDHAMTHPTSVDLVTVAELRSHVHVLDERYDKTSSASLLPAAGQHLGQVGFLRGHAAQSRVRRDLFAVEAEAATLMGQLVWDASQRRDHTTAYQYFRQAIEAARQTGDVVIEGLALLRTSFVALYGEKNPTSGLDLTLLTADTTRRSSHVLTGLATLHAAEAHAMRQQRRECERALGHALHHFSNVTPSDAAIELFSPSQYGRVAGSCYLFLGDAARAQSTLETTARALTDRSKSQAIVLGNLGLAHIQQQHLEEAVNTLHHALDVLEITRGGGGLNVVYDAGRQLRPWRTTPMVHDLHDRLLGLMTV